MGLNKKIFPKAVTAAAFDPLQNFETVTYTGNGGTQKITGYIRKGAAFNGSSSEIEVSSNVLNINTISIFAWINLSTTSGYQQIVSNYSSSNTGWGFRINDGGYLSYNTSAAVISGTTALSTNTWYHVGVTIDSSGNSTKLYINGQEEGSTTYTAPTYGSGNTNFHIGSLGNLNTQYFNGKIDQVRIFNRALDETTDGEVTTLYNETYASSTKSTTDIFGDGSGVALYELDEDANDTGVAIDAGQSAVFDGSSSKIELSGNVGLTFGSSASYSLSFWLNTDSLSSFQRLFSNILGITTENQTQIGINTDGSIWIYRTLGTSNAGYAQVESKRTSGIISINNWYYITIVMNSGVQTVYVNGVSRTLTSNANTQTPFVSNTIFGTDGNNINYFDGKLDDIRIYSDVLTSTEVGYIYNNTTASIPTDYTAYYKLDGNATDETGSYNGTATSLTYSDPALLSQYNGTPTNVNFLGMAFQPDLVWLKSRTNPSSGYYHLLYDSLQGANPLSSNTTEASGTYSVAIYGGLTSFDSNGFTLQNGSHSVTPYFGNESGYNYVAWCWKAGGAAVSNTDGTITSTVSANQAAGFSIVKYTGNLTASTIGHGLSSAPEMVVVKRTDSTSNWFVYSLPTGNTKYLNLDSTGAATTFNVWNNTSPTSSVFSLAAQGDVNASGGTYIAYCFHSVDGYQKVGSYTGNGGSSVNSITTGFRPRFLIYKRTDVGYNWVMYDSTRDTSNPIDTYVNPNTSDAETTGDSSVAINFVSNGFEIPTTSSWAGINASGGTYIYLAIA